MFVARTSLSSPTTLESPSAPRSAGRQVTPLPSPPPRLLDRVRHALRLRHYSRRTEKAYVGWIRRFILFHGKRHPAEMGAAGVSAFLDRAGRRRPRRRLHPEPGPRAPCSSSTATSWTRTSRGSTTSCAPSARRAAGRPDPRRGPRRPPAPRRRRRACVALLLYGAGLRLLECCRAARQGRRLRGEPDRRPRRQGRQGPRHHAPRRREAPLRTHLERSTAPARSATSRRSRLGRAARTPSRGSTPTPAASGPGSGSSRPPDSTSTARPGQRRRHHLHETVVQQAVQRGRTAAPASPSTPPATPSATPSPPTCSRTATTSAPFRSSSATAMSRTTMIYTHVLNRGPAAVRSPADRILDG